jgi:hypothetical protein
VFAKPAADLDFIHPTKLPDGDYAVEWAGVLWCQGGNCHTKVGNCDGGPGDSHATYESLYKSQGEVVLKHVTKDDMDWYGRPPWKIALLRGRTTSASPINGWNSTKGAQPPLPDRADRSSGQIPLLARRFTDWNYPPVRMTATVYGYGECQPNFQTANGGDLPHDGHHARGASPAYELQEVEPEPVGEGEQPRDGTLRERAADGRLRMRPRRPQPRDGAGAEDVRHRAW